LRLFADIGKATEKSAKTQTLIWRASTKVFLDQLPISAQHTTAQTRIGFGLAASVRQMEHKPIRNN
jgi:hypothetical protein